MDIGLMLKIAAYGGSALLAFMGAVVAVYPPFTRRGRTVWIIAFASVSLVTVLSQILDSRSQEKSQKDALIGGDNYCFYRAEIRDPWDLSRSLPLWINCSGPVYNLNTWIVPGAASDPNDPAYWSGVPQYFAEALPGGLRAGVAVKRQKYRIEMTARNGTVVENLDLKEVDGKLVQSIELYRTPTGKFYTEHGTTQ
jgi:hypothetical protein